MSKKELVRVFGVPNEIIKYPDPVHGTVEQLNYQGDICVDTDPFCTVDLLRGKVDFVSGVKSIYVGDIELLE